MSKISELTVFTCMKEENRKKPSPPPRILLSIVPLYNQPQAYDGICMFPIYAVLKHTETGSLYTEKKAVYYFQISVFVPEIFQFLKYAN